MKNRKEWRHTISSKKLEGKSTVQIERIADVYKREILDTRITVSELFSSSRMLSLNNFRRADAKVKRVAC